MSGSGEVYGERGFGGRQGAGERPALLIIDYNNAFTDPASPLHCDTEGPVQVTARLIAAARSAGVPVVYTTVAYDEGTKQAAAAFMAKSSGLALMATGTRWVEIDERLAPKADEPVLVKLFASAFFGTALASLLVARRCDSVIVTGASTSGCVRATVVDALQNGYRVMVPRDAVADRAAAIHEASLTDIDAKYGDVVDEREALAAIAAARF